MDEKLKTGCCSPFKKQCFVTLSQTLALGQFGLVMGFTSSLLPQLRSPDSIIVVDDASGSWIVGTPSAAAFFLAALIPISMGKLGRKSTSISALLLMIIGWLLITAATSISVIILGRILQGLSLGTIYCVSPIYIGECSSPKNRGVFLTTLSLALALGTLTAHLLGSYMSWDKRSLVCGVVAFLNLLIVLYCPETPCWLIDKGRYEEGKKAYFWLRGANDDDEIKKLIETDILLKETQKRQEFDSKKLTWKNIRLYVSYINKVVKKPEFYKPIFIMVNLNGVVLYSGVNALASYGDDIYKIILGDNVDIGLVLATADIQRLITNSCALYLIKKVKRRTMLISVGSLNALVYLAISGYIYGKSLCLIPEIAILGIGLIHLLMFTLALGSVPLPFIISGEIYPLEYRNLAPVLSIALNAPFTFIMLKTHPFLLKFIGLHGTFCLYAAVLEFCLLVSWFMLPETKDKTLQEIEVYFRGRDEEVCEETVESLTARDKS